MFHSLIVLSSLAEASVLPSEEIATQLIGPVCATWLSIASL